MLSGEDSRSFRAERKRNGKMDEGLSFKICCVFGSIYLFAILSFLVYVAYFPFPLWMGFPTLTELHKVCWYCSCLLFPTPAQRVNLINGIIKKAW